MLLRQPKNGSNFSDQAVHSFHFRLLRSELSQGKTDSIKASSKVADARELVRTDLYDKWWPSVFQKDRINFKKDIKDN